MFFSVAVKKTCPSFCFVLWNKGPIQGANVCECEHVMEDELIFQISLITFELIFFLNEFLFFTLGRSFLFLLKWPTDEM